MPFGAERQAGMTRRERIEARLLRRLEWSQKRQAKADGLLRQNERFRRDWAFTTQPGHIPERARVIAREDRAFENLDMARHHAAKADGLERQLERSIFSDDPDAVDALTAKAAEARARREWCAKVNAAWRKAKKPKADDVAAWDGIASALGVEPKMLAEARLNMARDFVERGPYPPYVLSNLGAEIRRCEARIGEIKRRAERQEEAERCGGVVFKRTPDGLYCSVTFAEKPERAILDALRDAHFNYHGGTWSGYAAKLPEIVAKLERKE